MEHPSSFFESERQRTDDSLIAERDKTNQSLTKFKTKAEAEADKTVQEERLEADETATASRTKADLDYDKERQSTSSESKRERENGNNRVLEERDRADKAVELERAQVDLAIETERELNSVLAEQLLEQERKLTDRNLLFERSQTDSTIHRASGLLSDEVANHLKTKVSLTTRDEFLAIVSHDLRNPIGAASACADMLLTDSAYKEMDPKVRYWVEFIKRNVGASLRLISDLLDMERIAEGKLQLNLDKHAIGKILTDVMESVAHLAAAKRILLTVDPTSYSGEVLCDNDRIAQVLTNLVGNALKFTPNGGAIRLSVEQKKHEVHVSVHDTGPGIPQEKQQDIFKRFAQLGLNDRRGLGLGLYISKMLIEAHGGRLSVHSVVGEGSTFTFVIPNGNGH